MQPTELFKILPKLQHIKGLKNLSQLKSCRLHLEPKYCSVPQEVLQKLDIFLPEQGWLCFQNKVKFFRKEEQIPTDSTILLYGEVVNADGISLHIREDGQGGWILTYLTETDGNEYLVENQTFLGEKKLAPERLYYRVYWQNDDKQGYRRVAARFTGFEDK